MAPKMGVQKVAKMGIFGPWPKMTILALGATSGHRGPRPWAGHLTPAQGWSGTALKWAKSGGAVYSSSQRDVRDGFGQKRSKRSKWPKRSFFIKKSLIF